MIQADGFGVKNYITFKEAYFPLSESPLCVVRGRNLDRKGAKSANAVGKSALFSALPVARYASAPTSVRKNSAKDMHRAGSEIFIDFHNGNTKNRLIQFQKGKTVRYQIVKNGKPQDYRTINDAFAEVGRILPISQEQFYSFAYIDGRNQSVLQRGTVSERFSFFQKVFELDIYEKIASKINIEYNALKFDAQRLKELEAEYTDKKKTIPASSLEELKARRSNLIVKAKKVRNKVDRFLTKLRHINTYMALSEGVDLSVSIKELKRKMSEAIEDRKDLAAQYKESVEYHAAKKLASKTIELSNEITNKLKKNNSNIKLRKKYRLWLDKRKVKLSNLADKISELKEFEEEVVILKKKLSKIKISAKLLEKYGEFSKDKLLALSAKYQAEGNKYTTAVKALSKHKHTDNSLCPTCYQTISVKKLNAMVAEFNSSAEKYATKYASIDSLIEYKELKDKIKSIDIDGLELLESKYKTMKSKCRIIASKLEQIDEKVSLLKQLSNLPSIDFKEKKLMDKPESIEALINQHTIYMEEIQSTIAKREKLKNLKAEYTSYDEAKQEYEKLQAYIDKYQPLLQKAQDTLQNMTVRVTQAESLFNELEELKKQIKKRKDLTSDFAIYESLRFAYGAKGLKQMRIAYLASQFQENLNKLAPTLYNEPIQFKINISNSKFDILATRNGLTSDVRMLSGFESKAFTLLSLLALLPFIPASSRCNFLILDEIESGLDEASMKVIASFLPFLCEVIPNVVVITPQNEKTFYIPNAVSWVVEKKNKISRIIKEG